ncbi:MAG: GTPase [Polyangiaceae bacterium]|nr:GTPase [Polyangiaceae bacterium]
MGSSRKRTVIMGAAGRDFHNFNMAFRQNEGAEVVAFTGAQIPGISGRIYPPELAGPLYPHGIPIEDEGSLAEICRTKRVSQVVFAYSDVSHETVMHAASKALAAGADFVMLGPESTMLKSKLPVIAISAVRTGCGKSQTSRWLGKRLREKGLRAGVLRHPMPYGDLRAERVQRFAEPADLDKAACTAEEREEYEPHIAAGNVVFAGVDYADILAAAEAESDILVWDGGNNDFPFLKPDLHIVVADALRPDQLATHHPGEATLRMADVVVINKVDAAQVFDVERMEAALRILCPRAKVTRAASPVRLVDPDAARGKRVLVVEDGPTITHGGMPYGAGFVAAVAGGAAEIIDPRDSAPPAIIDVFNKYSHIGKVLPAVGYDKEQLAALGETINRSSADLVLSATPIDLGALVSVNKPIVRARYELEEAGEPLLSAIVDCFLVERPTVGHAGAGPC